MPPSMTIMIDGGMTHHTVTGLQPFTNYECRVTASTSVGEGPPSDTETQRTVESSELCVVKVYKATTRQRLENGLPLWQKVSSVCPPT